MSARLNLLSVLCAGLVVACAPLLGDVPVPSPVPYTGTLPATRTPSPSPTPVAPVYALVAKGNGAYWADVERGALAAEKQLGLPRGSVVFHALDKEDAAAQILAMEELERRGVRGIALAPVEPRALELSVHRARDAGIWVTTFDTDMPQSDRIFFIGTPAQTIGNEAAAALLTLLGGRGGKIALGSTLSSGDASARIAAFKARLKANAALVVLDPVDDQHNPGMALQAAKGALASQKDLVGAFGLYAYNGEAWCRAIAEAKAAEHVWAVAFDATAQAVACLKDGALDAVIAPRPFALGWQSVHALDALARRGVLAAAGEMGVTGGSPTSAWVVDVGVDVVSRDGSVGQSLAEYALKLAETGAPPAWTP